MKTKNKMKDFEAKSEEWLEVAKEYFTKELEKKLTQNKANERIMKYNLKVYQKNFLDFIYGSPTSIEVLGKDEKTKTRPNGTTQKEKVQTEKP
jgi:hypothetical protein